MRIGVLAAQGAFAEHIAALEKLGTEALPVRLPRELEGLDGLVIPGGESTTIGKLMQAYNLTGEIGTRGKKGLPIFGTCAGMILMAGEIVGGNNGHLDLMDIAVRRNAFGRQRESFETELPVPVLGDQPFHAVFIRAPLIEKCGRGVEVLAKLADGTVVAARQGNFLVAAFHPELTGDLRFHRYFLDIASGKI